MGIRKRCEIKAHGSFAADEQCGKCNRRLFSKGILGACVMALMAPFANGAKPEQGDLQPPQKLRLALRERQPGVWERVRFADLKRGDRVLIEMADDRDLRFGRVEEQRGPKGILVTTDEITKAVS